MRIAPQARQALARHTVLIILMALISAVLAGCQPQSSNADGQGQTLPAVTEPTRTPSPVPPTPTTGPLPANGSGSALPTPTTPQSQAAAGPDAWTQHSRASADGTRLSYRYPPTWTEDLTYCPPEKNTNRGLGSHLPPGCASTDFLFGQKAAGAASGIKSSQSKSRSAGDMRVVTQVDTPLDTSKASTTYTVLVYNASGTPVSGFVTYIGPGTSEAEGKAILATLDELATTVTLEK